MKNRASGHPAILLCVVALLAAACGARVSDEQVAALRSTSAQNQTASGSGSGVARATATSPSRDPDAPPAATQHGSDPAGANEPAATTRRQRGTAPGEGTDNGGAVDIGVTADTITLGNVSTLSGPVPGIFAGATIGAQAVVAYQNSKGGLFGRRFVLDVRDDQFDSGQNRAQTVDLLRTSFAFLGSFSLYDDAAAAQIERAGIPDTSYSLSAARRRITNNFSPSPGPPRGATTSVFNYFRRKSPAGVTAVGTVFSDLARASHEDYKRAAESVGWNYVYERGVSPTETDFTADVVRMRQEGVKIVYLIAVDVAVVARLAKAMDQQGFQPEYFVVQGAAYDQKLFSLAGRAVEGLYSAQPYALFIGEDAEVIPEVQLFNEWLQKVKPGYKPDLFAAFAWSAGRMLFQAMEQAGPTAKRKDVIDALRSIKTFSANDLMAPASPATKEMAECYVLAQVRSGRFQRVDSPVPYRCGDGRALVFAK